MSADGGGVAESRRAPAKISLVALAEDRSTMLGPIDCAGFGVFLVPAASTSGGVEPVYIPVLRRQTNSSP